MSERLYVMNSDPIKVKLNIHPKNGEFFVTHILRRPTFEEEEARERNTPIITKEASRIEGSMATTQFVDDEGANLKLYDKIAKAVVGYPLNKGEKPTDEEIPVDRVLDVNGEQKTVLELIPSNHKTTAILAIAVSSFEVDLGTEQDEFSFALGAGREWTIKQSVGGQFKREDGTLAPPDYVVTYRFREPTEAERKKYRTSAMNALTYRTKEGVVERSSVNLKVIADLFDKLIEGVEGAVLVEGETEIPLNVRNADHLKQISASFKKSAIIRLFNALEADLGN